MSVEAKKLKSSETRYVARVRGADGKARKKTFRKKGDAQRWEREILLKRDQGQWADLRGKTLEILLNDYIDNTEHNWEQKTIDGYTAIKKQVVAEIGHIKLDKLRPMDFQSYYTTKLKTLSAKTVYNHYRFLHGAFNWGLKQQLVYYYIVAKTTPPKVPKTEQAALDIDEARALIKAVKDDKRYYIPVLLGLAMGLRLGEAYGLRWQDVDLDNEALQIRQALQRTSAGLRFTSPKSDTSKRLLTIPPSVVAELKQHRVRQLRQKLLMGNKHEDYDLVNCQANGKPWSVDNISKDFTGLAREALTEYEKKKKKKYQRKGEVQKITFHNLRHTNVTLLMEANIHSLKISKWVGHADTRLVDEVYAHVRRGDQKEITQEVERSLFGLGNN